MKTAVYFTKSFKPDAKEAKDITDLRKKYRHVSVRNVKLYKKESGIEHLFDAVFGCIEKSDPLEVPKESGVEQPANKPTTTKPWERNK